MNILALLYIIASIATVSAGLPQIIQIIRTKDVEGISLQTYDMWALFQTVSIPYTIESGNILWLCTSIGWLTYYVIVILLIEHYQYPHYIRAIVDRVVAVLRLVPVHTR